MSLLDLIAIVGFGLGIGAALDYMLKLEVKKSLARSIRGVGALTPAIEYGVSSRIDWLFGCRLASARAILVSVALSLISLSLAYVFAYITSDPNAVAIFERHPNSRSILIFSIFLIGCIIGDYFSFAQTRVFLRTVDNYRKGIIAVGLALSDAIISLSIFVGIFSLTRLVAYMIIIANSEQGLIQQTQHLNTEAIAYAVSEAQRDGLLMPSEAEWSSYIGKIASSTDASKFDQVARRYANSLVSQEAGKDVVSVEVSFRCMQDSGEARFYLRDAARLIAKDVAGGRGIELGEADFNNLELDIMRKLAAWKATNKQCPVPTLTVEQSLTPAGLLSVAGLSNAFFASFERTLFDFYTNFGFKLAPYAFVDPEADIGNFYDSLILQTQYTVLDAFPGNYSVRFALGDFSYRAPQETEFLRIPFSPMLASSLTVSIFFWLYIILVYLSRISITLAAYFEIAAEKVKLESAPFTFLFFGAGVTIIALALASNMIGVLWSAIFG